MKGKRLFGLVNLCALFYAPMAFAQYYHPVAVSGFTQDVIANGVGNASSSTTASVDAVDYAYVSKDFQATATSPALTYGLPVSGQFMSVVGTTPGLTYQLASYNSSNALKLNAVSDSGTLTFTTPTAAFNLYFLATGGSGSGVVSAVVNFTDGTNQTFTSLSVGDWYDQTNFAIQGIGRIKITTNALEDGGGTNPRIYQIPLAISATNQSKTVQNITFSKTSGTGFINIFGVSANRFTTCLAPTAVTASAVTVSSATLTWTAPATVPTNYDIYYTSSTVAPNSNTAPTASGVTGLTANITSGIAPMTKYHVWIRSNCGGSVGEWAYGTTFTTPCSTFTVPYSENFDTTSIGSSSNTNAPMCWSYLETSGFAGYGYVTNSNSNSPTNSYYLSNTSASTGNQMLVSPQTVALSDGTKRVKFYAKGSANYTLQVGTLTNPSDPSTFVSFNTTTITANHAQYTVNIPSGGGSYLAFRHNLGGTYRTIYLDDITVEAIPSCLEPVSLAVTGQTMNSVGLSWTDTATVPVNNYDIYYSTTNAAPTTSTVLNATNSVTSSTTTVTVPGLASETIYYFWVRSRCSATNQSIWVGSVNAFTGYCLPSSSNQNSWISAFTSTGAVTNMAYSSATAVAATNGYQNLSSTTNTISNAAGSTTSISMTAGGPTCGMAVWVDWNNDLVFSSTERMYVTSTYETTTPSTASITIPAGTPLGNYRMRVMCDYNSTAPSNACASVTRGEFLDFKLQVVNTLGTSDLTTKNKEVKVYPNPFSDIINISEFKDVKTVKVTDVAGRTLKTIENPSKEINLSSLHSGLYLITMSYKDGSQNTVKAIKK
ncbi:GEVED domain-containing protein [Chryseobacterium scophthalmum]|uniref:Por secretion system C-terminal sorting domain-containing protein n=1 Tax=Chryseobacterium scophthalmum TaxID=59733 RepID=A0A1N6G9C5_9FLAO|nr:GEVED domain-containing protein [Chryseobacterium scophthalmum]SIO04150.1 Por secretion system C-terminal sorting domain-containing protein [Chryseobacterium scophthalmum]